MLQDRGTKKWTAMMLPEHVKALRDWEHHEFNDESKPEIDDQQLSVMDDIMAYAKQHCLQIFICYYDHSIKRKVEQYGEVKKVDSNFNILHFLSEDGFSKRIQLNDILEIALR